MALDTVAIATSNPDTTQPFAELGLKGDEYARIKEILGRRPTSSELAMYSVMWSEHCSYKSSKVHLKQFACTQPHKTTFAFVDIGLVGRGKARTHFGVNAITGNDQVGLVLRANIGIGIDFGFKDQLNAHLFTALLQNIEQALSANAAKTMTT